MVITNIGYLKQADQEDLINHDPPFRIYKIEDCATVIYVGRSKDALVRMWSHLGMGEWVQFFGCFLDQLLIKEASDSFTVTLYDEDDVDRLVEGGRRINRKVELLEQRMIRELRPRHNTMGL